MKAKETAKQREQRLAYNREYNKLNKDKLRAYLKKWYQDNKEHVKETQRLYRLNNAEKVRKGAANRYETNKEYWSNSRKSYYTRNKKTILKRHKDARTALFAKDPKKAWLHCTVIGACSRSRKKGLPYDKDLSNLPLPDVCPVLGLKLQYVEGRGGPAADSPSLDRIVPALGYVRSNLRVISRRANSLKSDSAIDELKRVIAYMEDCLISR